MNISPRGLVPAPRPAIDRAHVVTNIMRTERSWSRRGAWRRALKAYRRRLREDRPKSVTRAEFNALFEQRRRRARA